MSNKTYIGLHPNNLNRTEYGQVVLYVEGEPVAFFSGSQDVIISGSLAIEGITNVSASIAAALSLDTGSFMITGSVNNDTITFTQGDGTTFDIIITSVTSSISASFAQNTLSASYAATASSADAFLVRQDLTVQGIVTAKEFHTEFVSASIIYQSGSTKFGDTSDDTHAFTGSVTVTETISSSDAYINDWGSISASLSTIQDASSGISLEQAAAIGNTITGSSIGIGTSSPTNTLHVAANSDYPVKIQSLNLTGDPYLEVGGQSLRIIDPDGGIFSIWFDSNSGASPTRIITFGENSFNVTGSVSVGQDLSIGTITNATVDTDKFLVSNGGTVEYRTGAQLASDIGAQIAVPTLAQVLSSGNTSALGMSVGPITGSTLSIQGQGLVSSNFFVGSRLSINVVDNYGTDPDKFLVIDTTGSVKYRTGAQVRSDIGAIGSGDPTLDSVTDNGSITTNSIQVGTISGSDLRLSNVLQSGLDTDKFLVHGSTGDVLYRTGAQVLSDIGAASSTLNLQQVTVNGNSTSTAITASALRINGSGEFTGNLTVGGTITAQEFHTEYVTAAVIYESGSTKFGDTVDDTHTFTGSLNVLGNLDSTDSYIDDWGSISASLASLSSSATPSTFDGDRPITQPLLPTLVNYNPGTTTVSQFLEQVFYPDPGFGIEILTNEPFYILESELSGSHVRGATTTNTPVGNYYNVFESASFTANTSVTWSIQTNSVLDIEPLTGKLFIKINLSGSATYQAPKVISGTVTANATSGGYKTRDFTVTVLDNTGPTISTSDITNYSPKAASFVTASGAYIGEVYINEQADPAGPPTIHTFGGTNPSFFSSSLYNQLAGVSYYKIYTTQALNSGSYVLNFTGSDLYGNEASASSTLVIDANTAPVLTVFLPFSGQIQNYSSGSIYGSITVTDNAGDAIDTFTLSGPDASYFAVNRISSNMGGLSARGQGSGTGNEKWAVNFNTTPPFTGTYNITASATDNFAFTGSLAIPNTLSATTPSLPSPNGTFYVIESALTGASVTTATSGIAGTVATMTTNQPVSWSLSDDLSGKLAISGSAVGYITLKDNLSGSAYQNGSVLSGVVRATNTYGLYKENNISVTITDNVGASISPNLSFLNNYYTKDGAAGFGNILVFDPQSIENVQLVGIGGPDGDKFIFVSQSAGQSVLYPFSSSQALNSGSYIVGVTASDSYGQFTSQSFTVSVFANNPPVIGLYSGSSTVTSYQPDIAQAVSGSTLGYVQVNDGDSGIDGIASFNFTGTDAAKFDAVFNGQVGNEYVYLIKTAESLTSGTYNLTGSAVDGFGFTTIKPIPVTATVQAPSIPDSNDPFYIIESAVSGAFVYNSTTGFSGTQAQFTTNQAVTWSLTNGTYLAIDSNGKLSAKVHISGSAKQAGNTITDEVVATNTFGASRSLPFSVAVVDDLDPVITNTLAGKNNNKTTTATGFGTITISDPQSLGNVSLTDFNGPDVGSFTFSAGTAGSTRVYTVSSSAALNSGSYSFSVTGSDAYNQIAKAAFTIAVAENLPPTVSLTGFTKDVSDAENNEVIGSASIADPQDDSIVSFTLSGTDASKFSASLASSTATTALYAVHTTQNLTSGSYNLTGSATDSFGLTTVTPIPVNITLAAPDVPIKNAVNFYIIESALSASQVVVNSDGYTGVQADMNTNQDVTWSIKSPSTYLAIDSNGGLSVKANISGSAKNASGAPYNLIQEYVVATNAYGVSSEVLVPVQVTANAAPTLSYTGLSVVSGSANVGNTVGTVTATDPQSLDSILSITITGGANSGSFALVQTGATSYTKTYNINVDGAGLGAGSYEVELTARDSFNKTTTETKTVTVQSTGTTPVYIYINTINRSNLDNTEAQALAAIGAQFYEQYDYANPDYPLAEWIAGNIGDPITVSGQGTATPKTDGTVADLLEIKTLGTITQDAAGSQPLFLFPSSSALPSLPNTMYLGSDFSTMPAGQHALITYATTPPAVTTAGVLYFTTDVAVDGHTEWGVVYGLTGATGTNEWTIAASGDTLP
jgi:hypothetical protein